MDVGQVVPFINAISMVVLVVITAWYAWVTHKTLKVNKSMVQDMNRPYIIIRSFVVPKVPMVYLSITNKGRTAAYKLRLVIDKDFYKWNRKKESENIKNLNMFFKETDCYPSGNEYLIDLGTGIEIFNGANPQKFSITATYSFGDKIVSETTHIDLTQHLEHSLMGLDPVANAIDGVNGTLRDLCKKIVDKKV